MFYLFLNRFLKYTVIKTSSESSFKAPFFFSRLGTFSPRGILLKVWDVIKSVPCGIALNHEEEFVVLRRNLRQGGFLVKLEDSLIIFIEDSFVLYSTTTRTEVPQ